MQLPLKLPYDLMLPKWAQILNPLLQNPVGQGSLLTGIVLKSGSNTFNHLLSQLQQGWIITDISAPATIYRSAPFNSTTLTLTSSAATTINLLVY